MPLPDDIARFAPQLERWTLENRIRALQWWVAEFLPGPTEFLPAPTAAHAEFFRRLRDDLGIGREVPSAMGVVDPSPITADRRPDPQPSERFHMHRAPDDVEREQLMAIKSTATRLEQLIGAIQNPAHGQTARYKALALTELESAVMWAGKAVMAR